MPFKRGHKNEEHLPASQREDADEADVEGQAYRSGRLKNEDYLPPAQREISDDGESDTEGQAVRPGR